MPGGTAQVEFVAAAGNNGADVLHFPAAWRNEAVATELTSAIVNAMPLRTGEIPGIRGDELLPTLDAAGLAEVGATEVPVITPPLRARA